VHDHLDTKLNAYNPLSVMPALIQPAPAAIGRDGHPGVVLETLDSRVLASRVTRLGLCRENDGTQDEKPQILPNAMICSE
jgi:hypothetical protein